MIFLPLWFITVYLIPKQIHNYSNINPNYPPLMSFINNQLGYILKKPKEKKKETQQ